MCVIPSIWIISIDEAGRKQRFLGMAFSQETRIKEFVAASFDFLNKSNDSQAHLSTKNVPRDLSGNLNSYYIDTKSLAKLMQNRHMNSISDQIAMALSLTELNNASVTTTVKGATSGTTLLSNVTTTAPAAVNGSDAKSNEKSHIECCDTDITYWFREDQYQNLFFQLFLLILVSSRWLVTSSAKLSSTQRTFILILSMANALDTLDLFSCLSLEFVFKNSYLIYALLLMVSISLLQFLFIPTVQSSSSDVETLHRNLSREYDESMSNSDNSLKHNEAEDLAHGHNYDDLRETNNNGTSGLGKKRELKFKLKNPRLSMKLFNRGYELGNKKISPNIQPVMFSYGMNNSYQHSQTYPYNKFEKVG
jgi:hypothetical protein